MKAPRLYVLDMCKQCAKSCKVKSLHGAVMVKCPDFKKKKKKG